MLTSSVTPGTAVFTASQRLALLDHFRTPYELSEPSCDVLEQVRPTDGGPMLLWPRDADAPLIMAMLRCADDKVIPLFAGVICDRDADSLLAQHGGNWSPACDLTTGDGEHLACVWRCEDGSVFLPFDPNEVIINYWSEQYSAVTGGVASRRAKSTLMHSYYQVRPLLPRPVQIWLRRRFAYVQARSRFPRWPAETGLHDFFDYMYGVLADIAERPIPRIAPWPSGYTWAFVLTHDVEHADGWAAAEPVLELERAHGVRSSWNLVPRRYEIDIDRVRELVNDGFEVGVHGLYHDGRDLESLAMVEQRLSGMRRAAEQWGARGFRSPATHRQWDLMPLLGFDHDSSYPDTDPFEPQGGGCCSWLPFFNRGMVELPMTLAQDHTLFVILRHRDESAWVEKTDFLRRQGGLALLDTHPDYLVDDRIMRAYARFLGQFADDESAWKALPGEVSTWWRRRADSSLEGFGEDWYVVGPAADEGRVELVGPPATPLAREVARAA
jgi:hypothetical protein